jgi:eukaryotic-like serine/threonine-protein kinase
MDAMTDSAERSAGSHYCPTCERTYAAPGHCPEDATRLVSLDAPDPLLGRVLDDRYTLTAKLGAGAMGAVYRATQHSVGRDVAVKVIGAGLVADGNAIKRFLREAKLASRLSHPNAVGVLDFGQTADRVFYLAMELVEGETLDALLKRDGPLSDVRMLRIAIQICDALEGAHRLQIVHRDLKPANIMVLAGSRELVKVLDFGIARSLADEDLKVTRTGATVGTPAFMAPEIALGGDVDARADLYSLGCMLYLMVSGRLPFAATNVQEMLTAHVADTPAPLLGVNPSVARPIMRLLEKERDARFETAAQTREALEATLFAVQTSPSLQSSPAVVRAQLPIANTATAPQLAKPPSTARRGLVVALAAGVVLIAAAISYGVIRQQGTHDDAVVAHPGSESSTAPVTPTPTRPPLPTPPAPPTPPAGSSSTGSATTESPGPAEAKTPAQAIAAAVDAGVAPATRPARSDRPHHPQVDGGTSDDTTEPF